MHGRKLIATCNGVTERDLCYIERQCVVVSLPLIAIQIGDDTFVCTLEIGLQTLQINPLKDRRSAFGKRAFFLFKCVHAFLTILTLNSDYFLKQR
jgi:hypothetical protein